MLVWPSPLPVYIVVSASFHLLPGQGHVCLLPVNSHLLGWETHIPAVDTDLPSSFSWETTCPGLEGGGSCVPLPAGDRGSLLTTAWVKVLLPFTEISLKKHNKTKTTTKSMADGAPALQSADSLPGF